MKVSDQYKNTATQLRKVAADLIKLKEKKKVETREKCAAVIVAKVGLEQLKNSLTNGRR